MDLSPREKDKMLIFTAGLVAERRKARGSGGGVTGAEDGSVGGISLEPTHFR